MVPRQFWIDAVERAWEHRSIVWLHGVRRIGKTTLCQSLDEVEYFDCELPSVRRQMAEPERLLSSFSHCRIALDEVHRLAQPSELLKIGADYDTDVKVVATGSSTLAAAARFSDTLAGRKSAVWLAPMMSQDLLDFGSGHLEHRLWWGGVPPFHLGGASTPTGHHEEWLDSYWARDIQELFRLEKRSAFLRLAELLMVNSGGIFEDKTYAAPCEVSRATITNYLGVLKRTGVAQVVRPYSSRRATEIVKAPRVFAFDTGFVRHMRGLAVPRTDDYGDLWEHYVLNEVNARIPTLTPRYWRTKKNQEVDFVFPQRGGHLLAVECKWSDANLGKLRGIRAFTGAYPDCEAEVVVPALEREYTIGLGSCEATVTNLAGLIARVLPPNHRD